MAFRGWLLLAFAAILARPYPATAQATAADLGVSEGIRLVETGDYDAGILALDTAARRLTADPARVRELSRAYLYLGIAYLGKGHEAAARAKFREAVASVGDLTLSPDEFPPKVIDLFEAARAEVGAEVAKAADSAAAASPGAPATGKGGSRTLLVVGGLGLAAAGAGIALAGGGGGGSPSASPAAPPTPAPIQTEDLSGYLPGAEGSRRFPIQVRAAGPLVAELSWTSPQPEAVELVMQLFTATDQDVALSNRIAPNAAVLRADVTPQQYSLSVFYAQDCAGCEANFRLLVSHP